MPSGSVSEWCTCRPLPYSAGRLGHERDAVPEVDRDLAQHLAGAHRPVGGGHRVGGFEVDLELARRAFVAERLPRDTERVEALERGLHERALDVRVVEQVRERSRRRERREVPEALGARRLERVVEHHALDLERRLRPQTAFGETVDHAGEQPREHTGNGLPSMSTWSTITLAVPGRSVAATSVERSGRWWMSPSASRRHSSHHARKGCRRRRSRTRAP